jgi:hypothetical protein
VCLRSWIRIRGSFGFTSPGARVCLDRRAKCDAPISDVIDFLMTVAANAGPDVDPPIYQAGGNGPKYANPGQFSTLHLRTTAHMWAWIYGVDRDEVIADGFEPSKQEDWYKVRTMPDAVRS